MKLFLALSVLLALGAARFMGHHGRGGGRGGGRGKGGGGRRGHEGRGRIEQLESLCDDAARLEADDLMETFAPLIGGYMGECYPNGDSFATLLLSRPCRATFSEGFCYNKLRAERFPEPMMEEDEAEEAEEDEAEEAEAEEAEAEEAEAEEASDLTYGEMRGEIDDLETLGHQLCKNAGVCYREIRKAVMKCHEDDSEWLQGVIDSVTEVYKEKYQASAADYASDNDDTISGTLLKAAMDRFTSVDDVEGFFNEIVGDSEESLAEDAYSGYQEMKAALGGFCDSMCVTPTADFMRSMFDALEAKDTCTSAAEFCGGCAEGATEWFADSDNTMPCCLQKVVDLAIEGVDYARETYSEEIEAFKDEVREAFADNEELGDEAEQRYQNVLDQALCFREVYEGSVKNNEDNICPEEME